MGGQYQPIGQTHVLQNIIDYDLSIQEAIDLPRIFALDNELKVEMSIENNIIERLRSIGHNIEITKKFNRWWSMYKN